MDQILLRLLTSCYDADSIGQKKKQEKKISHFPYPTPILNLGHDSSKAFDLTAKD